MSISTITKKAKKSGIESNGVLEKLKDKLQAIGDFTKTVIGNGLILYVISSAIHFEQVNSSAIMAGVSMAAIYLVLDKLLPEKKEEPEEANILGNDFFYKQNT